MNQPVDFTIRLLNAGDWPGYKTLFVEAAGANKETFEGKSENINGRPEIYWRNTVGIFSRFGGFAGDGSLLGVVGVIVLPLKNGGHSGHLFGRCLSPKAGDKKVIALLEGHFMDQGKYYRDIYKDLNQIFDFRGSFPEFQEWLGVKADFNHPITEASPFLLKQVSK